MAATDDASMDVGDLIGARLLDVQYAVAVTAATSANVSVPKAGTTQVHVVLTLDRTPQGGPAKSVLRLGLTVSQFYGLLSTLEEAQAALRSQEASQ